MAKVNLTLPNLDMDNLNDSQIIRKIASYLYIQNEQLRYELTHIDEDNMSSEDGTTVQGMTQDQVRKAIEEAIRKNKDIDLSSNTVIVNMQRKMDNLAKLQAQDASNITRITQELGNKVSQTTYAAGISGLKTLISGNTTLIGSVNTALREHLTEYGTHKHQISINDSTGDISISGPRSSVSNPNIASTKFFKDAVEAARKSVFSHDITINPGEELTFELHYHDWNTGHEMNTGVTFKVTATGEQGVTGLTQASRIGYNSITYRDSGGNTVTTNPHYWWYKDSLD